MTVSAHYSTLVLCATVLVALMGCGEAVDNAAVTPGDGPLATELSPATSNARQPSISAEVTTPPVSLDPSIPVEVVRERTPLASDTDYIDPLPESVSPVLSAAEAAEKGLSNSSVAYMAAQRAPDQILLGLYTNTVAGPIDGPLSWENVVSYDFVFKERECFTGGPPPAPGTERAGSAIDICTTHAIVDGSTGDLLLELHIGNSPPSS